MYALALTRWGTPPEQEAAALAARLGVAAYDLRVKLQAPLPVVLTRLEDRTAAGALLAELRGRGHGAVALPEAAVPETGAMAAPREFELRADAFVGFDPLGAPDVIAGADLVALVHAAYVSAEETTTTTTERKFSPGRALLTGGLAIRKTVEKVQTTGDRQREQLLYLFARGRTGPMRLLERRLRYDALGPDLQPTVLLNFATLIRRLRALAPGAFFDDRLASRPRPARLAAISGNARDRTVADSNVAETDLVAHILVQAYAQRQL
jgi:hypothetical protein